MSIYLSSIHRSFYPDVCTSFHPSIPISNISTYLFDHPSTHLTLIFSFKLTISLFTHQLIYPLNHLSIPPSIYIQLYIYLFISIYTIHPFNRGQPSIYPPINLSIPYISLFLSHLTIYLYIHPSIYAFSYPRLHPSVDVSISWLFANHSM